MDFWRWLLHPPPSKAYVNEAFKEAVLCPSRPGGPIQGRTRTAAIAHGCRSHPLPPLVPPPLLRVGSAHGTPDPRRRPRRGGRLTAPPDPPPKHKVHDYSINGPSTPSARRSTTTCAATGPRTTASALAVGSRSELEDGREGRRLDSREREREIEWRRELVFEK